MKEFLKEWSWVSNRQSGVSQLQRVRGKGSLKRHGGGSGFCENVGEEEEQYERNPLRHKTTGPTRT